MKDQADAIREKYDSLAPILQNRGEVLKKSLADYELLHDINEHRNICAEQQTLLGSDFMPKDIVSAEAALNKAANLKSEFASAENKVEDLAALAEKSENEEIKKEVENLLADRKRLRDAIDGKEKDLKDSVTCFTYLSDAAEARDWIQEKIKAAQADAVGSGTSHTVFVIENSLSFVQNV